MYDSFKRHIHYLRVSVTDRCNLRCSYCMPAEGVQIVPHTSILSYEEIVDLVREGVGLGIDKVRLTGGEPLLRRNIAGLVAALAGLDGLDDLAMTTNACRLPELAVPLKKAGLRRINISLDTLDPARFREITRGGDLNEVLAGIDAAVAAGFSPIKLNCVVNESPDEPDAVAVAEFGKAKGMPVRFIRRMNTSQGRFWRVVGGEGGLCSACNRLRVSSDGRVFPCLFNDISYSVRELGAKEALLAAARNKPHAGTSSANRFHHIGG
jgi:cyclic pyranopterin phosphate synthase